MLMWDDVPMMPTLETERLKVRPCAMDDLEACHRLHVNSHLLKYTEEALAETWGTLNSIWGLKFPLVRRYASGWRILAEGGVGAAVYSGILHGSYTGDLYSSFPTEQFLGLNLDQ